VVLALASLPTEERVERVELNLVIGYADVDAVQRLAREMDLIVIHEDYGADVRYRLAVPASEVDEVERRIADLTRGDGKLTT
jgi:putative IMPACT (imprinted ancient) family translation regulator